MPTRQRNRAAIVTRLSAVLNVSDSPGILVSLSLSLDAAVVFAPARPDTRSLHDESAKLHAPGRIYARVSRNSDR